MASRLRNHPFSLLPIDSLISTTPPLLEPPTPPFRPFNPSLRAFIDSFFCEKVKTPRVGISFCESDEQTKYMWVSLRISVCNAHLSCERTKRECVSLNLTFLLTADIRNSSCSSVAIFNLSKRDVRPCLQFKFELCTNPTCVH